MDGSLVSAFVILLTLYAIIWMRSSPYEEMYVEDATDTYKNKIMLMFAKYGQGKPVDITTLDADTLSNMFKDFLILFNDYQYKIGGKASSMDEVQKVFPIDFINEYNANIMK